eukprot:CAMPEP_0115109238 /NCGR_PEP_ID=MMETSP0227-20121206/38545_1 /TAXON_ID=89957 /ORGANISM="Polarella glacialis, Strain CCMP 1383" /LENGTH=133 /DNA_ID=CAMNT_0002507815 /DNA_START=45 /DNA_END=446 /DNA_ORIENTATION=-
MAPSLLGEILPLTLLMTLPAPLGARAGLAKPADGKEHNPLSNNNLADSVGVLRQIHQEIIMESAQSTNNTTPAPSGPGDAGLGLPPWVLWLAVLVAAAGVLALVVKRWRANLPQARDQLLAAEGGTAVQMQRA